jgi:hypothetical protein
MTDTSCSAERPPNSNATRSLSAMSRSPNQPIRRDFAERDGIGQPASMSP